MNDVVENLPRDAPYPQQESLSFGRAYQWLSVVGALMAIVVTPLPQFPAASVSSLHQHAMSSFLFKEENTFDGENNKECSQQQHQQQPAWFRWFMKLHNHKDNKRTDKNDSPRIGKIAIPWWLDTNIWQNSTAVIDKILTSSPRLLLLANFWLVCTWVLPTWMASWCLGRPTTTTTSMTPVVCKFLVLSSSVIDTRQWLDGFLLVLWVATLQFLRALAGHGRAAVLEPERLHRAVPLLLLAVLFGNTLAAACCAWLLHQAGYRVVLVLTWECLLVAVDVMTSLLQYSVVTRPSSTQLLEGAVAGLELGAEVLTVIHYMHIWSLHGLQFTLVDGVLALELHSAVCKTLTTLLRFRREQQLSRDVEGRFASATATDLQKAVDDVCCICLREFNDSSKRLECGHLYHPTCLRQVVHRARSLHAARCPLCREPVIGSATVNPAQQQQQQPLFRFSTQHWSLPPWLPALSLEVVRQDAAVEELAAVFPHVDRHELAHVLRRRGTVANSVEALLVAQQQQREDE